MIKSSSTIQIYQKMDNNSIVKSPSTTKNSSETPTPTTSHQPNQDAFNSSDIVRIYVPPADDMIPNDMKLHSSNNSNYNINHKNSFQRDRGDDEISQCSNRSSIVHVEYETLPYDISPTHSKEISISSSKNHHEQGFYYYFSFK